MPTKCYLDLDHQFTYNNELPQQTYRRFEPLIIQGIRENNSLSMSDLISFEPTDMRMTHTPCYQTNSIVSWDSDPRTCDSSVSAPSPVSVISSTSRMCLTGVSSPPSHEAYLKLKVAPESRFRYRYDTEMSGTHGSLPGVKSGREKAIPTVELCNYVGEAFIRVRLTTCTEDRSPHPHSLFVKEKVFHKNYYPLQDVNKTRTGHYCDPLYARVGQPGCDHVARFEGMCIISCKKEMSQACVKNKLEMLMNEREYDPYYNFKPFDTTSDGLQRKVDEVQKRVDVDFVSLCFEAFRIQNGVLVSLCPPLYSDPIANAKSAKTGKLKIVKINQCSGSCKGGDEIWLLVEKINKDGLVIKFYETNDEGQMIWESVVEESKLELHHQYAIIFTTPEYRNITNFVEVKMRLERRKHTFDCSEPVTFVYVPHVDKQPKDDLFYKESTITQPKIGHNKRARTESSTLGSVSKRRNDLTYELDMAVTLEDDGHIISNPDILEILEEGGGGRINSWEFLSKLSDNRSMLEELLSTLAGDDIDMRLAKDGTQQLINMLVKRGSNTNTPIDNMNVKRLIDKINSTMFIQQDKERLKDAASTLLSLRKTVVKPEIEDDGSDKMLVLKAIQSDKCNIVEELVGQGYSTTARDKDGNTSLHVAVLQHCHYCLQTLLNNSKTCLNVVNNKGYTPLHVAVMEKHKAGVELLMKSGADVRIVDDKTSYNVLHTAVQVSDVDCVRMLLSSSECVDIVNDRTKDGLTPLHIACISDEQQANVDTIVRLLLEHKADPHIKCPDMGVPGGEAKSCFELAVKNKVVLEVLQQETHKKVTLDDETKDKLYEALNKSEGWKKLVDVWNITYIAPHARHSKNPARYVFNCYETDHTLNTQMIRSLMSTINETDAVDLLDEFMSKNI